MKSHQSFQSVLLQNSKQHCHTESTLKEISCVVIWETGIIVVQPKIDFIELDGIRGGYRN